MRVMRRPAGAGVEYGHGSEEKKEKDGIDVGQGKKKEGWNRRRTLVPVVRRASTEQIGSSR